MDEQIIDPPADAGAAQPEVAPVIETPEDAPVETPVEVPVEEQPIEVAPEVPQEPTDTVNGTNLMPVFIITEQGTQIILDTPRYVPTVVVDGAQIPDPNAINPGVTQ